MGRRLGWRWGRCRTFLEHGPPPPQQDVGTLGVLAWSRASPAFLQAALDPGKVCPEPCLAGGGGRWGELTVCAAAASTSLGS